MSTFAVFGMSRSHARQLVKKKSFPMWLSEKMRLETPEEFEKRIEKGVEKLMEGTRVTQLSPLFDAPQFCREFISLAQRSDRCRSLQIRYKERALVTRKNRQVMRTVWSQYQQQESR